MLLGDVRAQELVGELFEKVRGDNDPDDEGQVRDILCKFIVVVRNPFICLQNVEGTP